MNKTITLKFPHSSPELQQNLCKSNHSNLLYLGLMSARHLVLPIAALDHRHPGLTPAISAGYLEAAAVCLSRHHETPTAFELQDNDESITVMLVWDPPSP
jgi:hypothetical protein